MNTLDLIKSTQTYTTKENNISKSENVIHIVDNFYIIRTQVGLNKTIKRLCENWDVEKVDITKPITYPIFVNFGIKYYGIEYLSIDFTHLNVIKSAVENE